MENEVDSSKLAAVCLIFILLSGLGIYLMENNKKSYLHLLSSSSSSSSTSSSSSSKSSSSSLFALEDCKDIFSRSAPEAVDLGLSVKWARCNVGASNPNWGGLYAWGETEEKADYTWPTYKYSNSTGRKFTKYCTNVDNRTRLAPEDDVAYATKGAGWRVPTKEEFDELRKKCKWEWVCGSKSSGYLVTGPNGNRIYLPAQGGRYGTNTVSWGESGYYWTSSICEVSSRSAYYFAFERDSYDWNVNVRCSGFSIRPVCDY